MSTALNRLASTQICSRLANRVILLGRLAGGEFSSQNFVSCPRGSEVPVVCLFGVLVRNAKTSQQARV